jgi:hypothetical protein
MPQQPEARGVGRSRPPAAPWVAALGATLLMQVVALFATQALPVVASLVTRGAGLPPEAIGQLYGLSMLGSVLFMAFGTPVLARLGPVRTLQAPPRSAWRPRRPARRPRCSRRRCSRAWAARRACRRAAACWPGPPRPSTAP